MLCFPNDAGLPEYSDLDNSLAVPAVASATDTRPSLPFPRIPEPGTQSENLASPENFESNYSAAENDPPYRISVWGTVHTEFGDVSKYAKVILFSQMRNRSYRTYSDTTGYFQVNDVVPASDYQMRVIPRGMFRRHARESLTLTVDQTDLSVVLSPLPVATLRGVVVDPRGNSISKFGVKVQSANKPQWAATVITNDVGQFQVEDVPIGELEFSSTYGEVLRITGHQFKGDSQFPLPLVVDHGGNELRGLVYDRYYNLVGGANVMLGWESIDAGTRSVVNRHTVTDATGQFSLDGIGNGEYNLVLTTATGISHRQTVEIGGGSSILTIVLSQSTPLY